MSEPQNPFLGKSPAELERQKQYLEQAMAANDARADVAAAAALRWAYNRLKKREKLGAAWENFSHQGLPKEALLAKPAGFSETEIKGIEDAVTSALEKAAKG